MSKYKNILYCDRLLGEFIESVYGIGILSIYYKYITITEIIELVSEFFPICGKNSQKKFQ